MTDDAGNLANLRDLVVPPPVPFWPPATGFWILAVGMLALLAVVCWRSLQRFRANAYRRAALAELDRVAARVGQNGGTIEEVSAILKRTALVAYPRPAVAPLSGEEWASFLAKTAAKEFDPIPAGKLLSGACDGRREVRKGELETLIEQARIWVRRHEAPPAAGTG